MDWTTACPDWAERLKNGRSIIPAPIFLDQAEAALADVQPVYETMPGWQEDITKARCWNDLPETCKKYIERIEKLLEVPVSIISVGPDRAETFFR